MDVFPPHRESIGRSFKLSTETSEFDYWRIGSHEFGGGGEREVLPNSPIIFYAGFYLLQETASDLLVGWVAVHRPR
jgi:hypothetical protein